MTPRITAAKAAIFERTARESVDAADGRWLVALFGDALAAEHADFRLAQAAPSERGRIRACLAYYRSFSATSGATSGGQRAIRAVLDLGVGNFEPVKTVCFKTRLERPIEGPSAGQHGELL